MDKKVTKPSPEAKALSLYLMAYKNISTDHKNESKRMNKLWDMVGLDKLSKSDYILEVDKSLKSYGGYTEVVEKTVKHYIDKTGAWKLEGDDKFCKDAQQIADRILKK